jgi:hypothetical protein
MTLLLVCPDPTDRAEVQRLIAHHSLDVVLVDAVPRALDAGAFRAMEDAIAAHLPDPEPPMLTGTLRPDPFWLADGPESKSAPEPRDFDPFAPLHAPERDRTDRRARRDPSGRRERRDYVERSRRP